MSSPLPPPPPPPSAPPPPPAPPTYLPYSLFGMFPPVAVPGKCPRCGTSFWVGHTPISTELGWAFCPRCGQPVPSVPPRPSPPLFSWEVYRTFYPEPSWPRSPTRKARRVLALLLLVAGLALVGAGGAFAAFGSQGLTAATRTVEGSVTDFNHTSGIPLGGVEVTLTGLGPGADNVTLTGSNGHFAFAGVPAGEHQLRAWAPGFRISQMELFLAPSFDEPSGNLSSLSISLLPGPTTAVYDQPFAIFPDLETYLAYVFSAAAIEVVGGLVAVAGALSLLRSRSSVKGVVGACSAALTPILLGVAGYTTLFQFLEPWGLVGNAAALLIGALVFLILLQSQRPLDGVDLPPPPQ